MKKLITGLAAVLAFGFYGSVNSAKSIEIEVAYPYSGLFDVTFQAIMPEFEKAHPDIQVKFRATYENYEDATATIFRESTSGNLPDVTMQGLNRQAPLVDKGIAKSLEPFIAGEADFEKDGYHSAMLSLSTFGGEVYGLPFSVSTPVGYYNMDLLAEAGIDSIPTNWDEVIAACNKLEAAGKGTLYFGWNITGNWFHQALMHTQNVPMVKDGAVNMGGDAGLATLQQMHEDFVLKTAPFPGMAGVNNGTPARLPAGGNAAMLVSTSDDPARVDAAWTFLKFITSGIGAALVAETTGYVPPNKAANDLLGDFYTKNPNKLTAVNQLPLLADWFAYPGENGLAITQVIYDYTEEIATGSADNMADLQEEMMEEIEDLL